MPMTLKNDVQMAKIAVATTKSKSYAPLENTKLKMQDYRRRSKAKPNIYDTKVIKDLLIMSHNKPGEKLHKTSCCCSCASSSNGSIFYRVYNKQRLNRQYPPLPAINNLNNGKLNCTPDNLMTSMPSTRSRHISPLKHSIEQTMEMSGKIQKDLIAIEKLLKSRFKLMEKSKDPNRFGKNCEFKTKLNSNDYRDVNKMYKYKCNNATSTEVQFTTKLQLAKRNTKLQSSRACRWKSSAMDETVRNCSTKLQKHLPQLLVARGKSIPDVQAAEAYKKNFGQLKEKQFYSNLEIQNNIWGRNTNKTVTIQSSSSSNNSNNKANLKENYYSALSDPFFFR